MRSLQHYEPESIADFAAISCTVEADNEGVDMSGEDNERKKMKMKSKSGSRR